MGFKDWFNKELANDKRSAVYIAGAKRGFEAGQQSKQAEIDALKMTNHNLSVQVIDANAYAEHWQKVSNKSQAEIDALQNRIDEALDVFKSDLSEIGKFDTIHKILKGELK